MVRERFREGFRTYVFSHSNRYYNHVHPTSTHFHNGSSSSTSFVNGHRWVPYLNERIGHHELRQSNGGTFTIFVDNLPTNMNNVGLKQLFKNDGDVLDVYTSSKVRKNKEGNFDFVRLLRKYRQPWPCKEIMA